MHKERRVPLDAQVGTPPFRWKAMTRSAPMASEFRRNVIALLVIGSILWFGKSP